jgi:hypothetical protein
MSPAKKKAEPEPATVRNRTVESCVNCGAPATQRTTNRGAEVAHFCDTCGRKVYGSDPGKLEPLG